MRKIALFLICLFSLFVGVGIANAQIGDGPIGSGQYWYIDANGNLVPIGDRAVVMGTTNSLVRVVSVTDASYTVGTDARDLKGTYFINADDDAVAFVGITAVAGGCACFENKSGVTGAITVTPGAGDYLVKQGVRGTVATAYTSSGAAGDKICILCIDDTDCNITTEVGTWSE